MQPGIVVRQGRYRDGTSVGAFLGGLSVESRQRRFFNSLPYVSPSFLRRLVTITPEQLVLLALDRDVVVGHAMASCAGERAADVGIVVTDTHQRNGIGTRLLDELSATVAAIGITELRCDVLSENYVVLDWLRRALPGIRFARNGLTMAGRWTG
jgi:ribosomal protein S18 acetylase RimI-like enzyme